MPGSSTRKGELRSLREEISILEQEKETELKDIEQELQMAQDEIHTLRQAAEDAAVEHEGDIASLQEDLCRMRSQLSGMERMQEEYEMEINSLRSEIQLKDSDNSESMVLSDVSLLQEELQQLRDRCNLLTEEYNALQMSNSSLCEQLEEMESQRYCSEDPLEKCREMRMAERWSKKMMSTAACQTSGMDMFVDILYPCEEEEEEEEEESENLRQQLHGAEGHVQEMQKKCKDLHIELQELQKVHRASEEEQRRLQKELINCKDDIYRLKSSQDALIKSQTDELMKKLAEVQKKYQESQSEQASLIKARNQLQGELLASKEEQRKLMVKRGSLAESNKNEKELKAKLEDLQNRYSKSQEENSRLLHAQEKLQEDLEFYGLEVERLKSVDAANQEAFKKELKCKAEEFQNRYCKSQEENCRLLDAQEKLQEDLEFCGMEVERLKAAEAANQEAFKKELKCKVDELQNRYCKSQEENCRLLDTQEKLQEDLEFCGMEVERLKAAEAANREVLKKNKDLEARIQDLEVLYQDSKEKQARHLQVQQELQEALDFCHQDLEMLRKAQNQVKPNKCEDLVSKLKDLQELYNVSQKELAQLQFEQAELLENQRRLQEEQGQLQEELHRLSFPVPKPNLLQKSQELLDKLGELEELQTSYQTRQEEQKKLVESQEQLLKEQVEVQEELRHLRESQTGFPIQEKSSSGDKSSKPSELSIKIQELHVLYQTSNVEQEQLQQEQGRLLEERKRLQHDLQLCQEEMQLLQSLTPRLSFDNRTCFGRSYVSSSSSSYSSEDYCNESEDSEVQEVVACVMNRLQAVKAMYLISQGEHNQLQLDMMQLLRRLSCLQEELELCQEELRECEESKKMEEPPPVVLPQNSPESHRSQSGQAPTRQGECRLIDMSPCKRREESWGRQSRG
uniref:Coiled-coil domain containing 136 n=1 Tax=Sarcophilus harrisii TaxID=9305 RepID=A0A7N4PIR3_SARHA